MRVVYIPDYPEYGGAYNSFCEMVSTIAEEYGIEPVILTCRHGKYTDFANRKGYENYVIGHRPFLIGKGNGFEVKTVKFLLLPFYYVRYIISSFRAVKRAEKLVDFCRVDLIHTNVNRDDIGAILAKRNNVKHVWHLREPGEKERFYSLRSRYIDFMNKNTNMFIAISDLVRDAWIHKGIESGKVQRIYNGIDTGRFLHSEPKMIDGQINIIMAGRIAMHKGQELLIEALAELSDEEKSKIHVDFYGSSEIGYLRRLMGRSKKLQVESVVEFHPYNEEIEQLLPKYDIGIMCSTNEGFGRVTIEYMLAGLCVVATNSGANSELIEDGVNGYLIKNNLPFECTEIIRTLLNSKHKILKIGENARIYAMTNFSKEKNAGLVYGLYKEFLTRE